MDSYHHHSSHANEVVQQLKTLLFLKHYEVIRNKRYVLCVLKMNTCCCYFFLRWILTEDYEVNQEILSTFSFTAEFKVIFQKKI